jgi:hypothetical protein
MAAAQDVLIEALLGADIVAKLDAARQLTELSQHDDTKVDSIAPLLELARCGAVGPAAEAMGALGNLVIGNDDLKVRFVAAGGVEVFFGLCWSRDGLNRKLAAAVLDCLGSYEIANVKIEIEHALSEGSMGKVGAALRAFADYARDLYRMLDEIVIDDVQRDNVEFEESVLKAAKDIIEVQELKLQSGRFLADVQDLVQSALAEFDADSDGAELGWGFSDSDYESDPFDY